MELYPNVLAERVAALFRVLGDATRLRLLQALAGARERTVGDLAAAVQTTVPNASKHLLVLAQAGLLRRERAGGSVWYSLADPATLDLVAGARAALGRVVDAQQREISGRRGRGSS